MHKCLIILSLGLMACSEVPKQKPETKKESTETTSSSYTLPKVEVPNRKLNVGFLALDSVFNTELTAPYDIFHHTMFREGIPGMKVFTVGKTKQVISFEGLTYTCNYVLGSDSVPNIDILVVPSAKGNMDEDLKDTVVLDFIRKVDSTALFVTSHCDGAFMLAEAGVLNGHHATTYPGDLQAFKDRYPEIMVNDTALFVHDGKYITSAGGAKSFEAALYLVELLYGKQNADDCAEGMVIDWDLNSVKHHVVP